jgi:hypothetical protein
MTAYWSSDARIEYLDANHFVNQIATISQICGDLVLADVDTIKSVPASPGQRGMDAADAHPKEVGQAQRPKWDQELRVKGVEALRWK